MNITPFLIILTGLLLLVVYLFSAVVKLKQKQNQQFELINALQLASEQQYFQVDEQCQQLMQRMAQLHQAQGEYQQQFVKINTEQQRVVSQIREVQQAVENVQQQQPQDKLYNRALKLAALGADAKELMQDCQLSAAEAEMLLSIHQRKK